MHLSRFLGATFRFKTCIISCFLLKYFLRRNKMLDYCELQRINIKCHVVFDVFEDRNHVFIHATGLVEIRLIPSRLTLEKFLSTVT